jgi:hypothetical protein
MAHFLSIVVMAKFVGWHIYRYTRVPTNWWFGSGF